MSDILDIYDDLNELDKEAERKLTEQANLIKDEEIKVLKEKSNELEKELAKLTQENISVKMNFYSYMEISRRELERRNNEVTTLRKQKDDLLFKRNAKGENVTKKIDKGIQSEEQNILKSTIIDIKKFETKTTQTAYDNDKPSRDRHSNSSSNDNRSNYYRNDSRKDDYSRSSSRRYESSSYSKYSKSSRDSRYLKDDRSRSGSFKEKRDSKSTEKSSEKTKRETNCLKTDESKSNTVCKNVNKSTIVDKKLYNDLKVNEILPIGNEVILDINVNKEKVTNLEEKPTANIKIEEKTEIPIDSMKTNRDKNDDCKKNNSVNSLHIQPLKNSSNSKPDTNNQYKNAIKRKRDSLSSERSSKQLKVDTEIMDKSPDTEIKNMDIPKMFDDQILCALNLSEVKTPKSIRNYVNVEKENLENNIESCSNISTDKKLNSFIVEEKLDTECTIKKPSTVVPINEKIEVPLSVTECVKILLAQVSDNSSDDEIYPVVDPGKSTEKMNISTVYNEADDDITDVATPKDNDINNKNINKLNIKIVAQKDSLNINEKLVVVETPDEKTKNINVEQEEPKQLATASTSTKETSKNNSARAKNIIKAEPRATRTEKKIPQVKVSSKTVSTNNNNIESKIDNNSIKEITTPKNTDNNLNKANEKRVLLTPTSTYVIQAVSNKVVNVFIKRKTCKIKRKSH